MLKNLSRLALISLIALLASGCWIYGFGVARAVPIGPGAAPPTPAIPQIHIAYDGKSVAGAQTFFNWTTGSSGGVGGGMMPAPGSLSALTIPVGSSIDIVISGSAPPAALWIAELDGKGTPINAAALTPVSTLAAYTVSASGQYKLQVLAEWDYQNQVMYIFELNVTP